jgi:hypothetical protein
MEKEEEELLESKEEETGLIEDKKMVEVDLPTLKNNGENHLVNLIKLQMQQLHKLLMFVASDRYFRTGLSV